MAEFMHRKCIILNLDIGYWIMTTKINSHLCQNLKLQPDAVNKLQTFILDIEHSVFGVQFNAIRQAKLKY